MPRCIICNSCSETDGISPNKFKWDQRFLGYFCRDCLTSSALGEPSGDYGVKTLGEVPILDADTDDLEGLEILEEFRMGKD